MASSGSFYTNRYDGTVRLKLSWRSEQSIAENTSTIYWTLESDGGSSGQWWYSAPITVVIGGKTALSITSRFKLYGDGRFRKTGNLPIQHNEDGTMSVAMSVKAAIYSSSVNCTGSKTFTLDKINRYALLTSVEDFTDEGNPTITYINSSEGLATNVQVRMKWMNSDGVTWDNTSWSPELTDEIGAYMFVLDSYRNRLRQASENSKTLNVIFELRSTIQGIDFTDSKEAVMSVVNANPVIDANTITYADTSSIAQITGDNQVIVRSKSTLTINIDPSNGNVVPQKNATIGNLGTSAYGLKFNGVDYTPDANGDVEIVAPDMSGVIPAILTVTDSRGNTSSLSLDITVFDWKIPSFEHTLARKNGFEDETVLTVNATFSSVDSINAITITEQHRKKGTSIWSNAATVTNGVPFKINDPTGLDKQYEWEVKITVTDLFYSPSVVDVEDIVGKGIPLFYPVFNRNSLGINGFPDDDEQLYVEGNVKITGNLIVNGTPWSGRIQQVTLTQSITINTPDASGYFQLNDNLVFPDPNAVLLGMQVKCQNISATSGTIYSLVYWEDGQRPYIMYQHASVNFSNISHDFIFTFYVP